MNYNDMIRKINELLRNNRKIIRYTISSNERLQWYTRSISVDDVEDNSTVIIKPSKPSIGIITSMGNALDGSININNVGIVPFFMI